MSDVSSATATLDSPIAELAVKDHLREMLERELTQTRSSSPRFTDTAPPRFSDLAPPASARQTTRFSDIG